MTWYYILPKGGEKWSGSVGFWATYEFCTAPGEDGELVSARIPGQELMCCFGAHGDMGVSRKRVTDNGIGLESDVRGWFV